MTVLTGFFAKEALYHILNPHLTTDLADYEWVTLPGETLGPLVTFGTVQNNLPVSTTPNIKSGALAGGFFYDYYNRVHIVPKTIDLGNLVNVTQKPFVLWNAHIDAKTLNEVNSNGALGLAVTDFSTMPSDFAPLAEKTYTLTAFTEGPNVINASYQFVFASGDVAQLDITGQRLIVFPFKPNWESAVTETLEWKTNVLKSYDDSEQRRKLRNKPRRGFEYKFLVKNDAAKLLENMLIGWQSRDFAVPVWMDRGQLTDTAAIGEMTIKLDTTNIGFENGTMALLYNGYDNYEAVTISSFTESQVNISFPLQKTWHIGSMVYPIVVGHLPTSISLMRHTDTVITGQAAFSTNPDITPNNLPVAAAPFTYDGLEVITKQPNWKNGLDNEFLREFYTVDFTVGVRRHIDKHDTTRITRPFGWLLKNKAEIMGFRKLIQRLQGQLKTCWIPSWHNDFKVVDVTPAGALALFIGGTEFYKLVGVNTSRDRIMITLHTGEVYYRKITGMTIVTQGTQLAVDSVFPIQIDPENVKTVHILLRCRMASDKVEIPWRTESIADPTITFTTVKL
jgi:hypothetical protein